MITTNKQLCEAIERALPDYSSVYGDADPLHLPMTFVEVAFEDGMEVVRVTGDTGGENSYGCIMFSASEARDGTFRIVDVWGRDGYEICPQDWLDRMADLREGEYLYLPAEEIVEGISAYAEEPDPSLLD